MGLRDKARESASRAVTPPSEKPPEERSEEPTPPKVPEEVPAAAPAATLLEPSVTYLVEEERPELAYSLFMEASKSTRGMIVSRTYPKNLRKALNLGDVPIFWLTNAMSDEAIGPKDLERLTLAIRRFMEEGGGRLVLIDSLEYVITNNKFVSVLRLLQTIRDIVAIHKGIGIISLKSSTLEPAKLASVQRELEIYSADKSAVALPQLEVESKLISELRHDEVVIEAERVEEEKKRIATQAAKLSSDAQKVAADRQDLEKERLEVRQTLVKVRQTRKELENFRIKLTKEEADLTSKVRAKLAKEMQILDSKKANLETMEKEVESRYQQLDRIVGLKTEQKLLEIQNEKKRIDTDRQKLTELMARAEAEKASVDQHLAAIKEKEGLVEKSLEEAKAREKKLQEREYAMALDKVEIEKQRATIDSDRNELDRFRKQQEDEISQMKAEIGRISADVSQREESVSKLTHELETLKSRLVSQEQMLIDRERTIAGKSDDLDKREKSLAVLDAEAKQMLEKANMLDSAAKGKEVQLGKEREKLQEDLEGLRSDLNKRSTELQKREEKLRLDEDRFARESEGRAKALNELEAQLKGGSASMQKLGPSSRPVRRRQRARRPRSRR